MYTIMCMIFNLKKYNILQHPKAKKTLSLITDMKQTFPDPHTFTTTDIKTNMRHIHTSIVSRYIPSPSRPPG